MSIYESFSQEWMEYYNSDEYRTLEYSLQMINVDVQYVKQIIKIAFIDGILKAKKLI